MINILQYPKYEMMITFDEEGLEKLLKVFQDALNKKGGSVEVYNEATNEKNYLEIFYDDNNNEISIHNDKITIRMIYDSIDFIVIRLIECKDTKYFFPAEACNYDYEGRVLLIYMKYIECDKE